MTLPKSSIVSRSLATSIVASSSTKTTLGSYVIPLGLAFCPFGRIGVGAGISDLTDITRGVDSSGR